MEEGSILDGNYCQHPMKKKVDMSKFHLFDKLDAESKKFLNGHAQMTISALAVPPLDQSIQETNETLRTHFLNKKPKRHPLFLSSSTHQGQESNTNHFNTKHPQTQNTHKKIEQVQIFSSHNRTKRKCVTSGVK